jgi:hypothetical protein
LGIPVVSMKLTMSDGTPRTAIALPTVTGLGGGTTNAVCVFSGFFDAINVMRGGWGDNTTGVYLDTITGGNGGIQVAPSAADAVSATYQFNFAATHWPSAAKAVYIEFDYVATATATAFTSVADLVFAPNSGAGLVFHPGNGRLGRFTAGDPIGTNFAIWLPTQQGFPRSGDSGGLFNVTVTYAGSNITFSSAKATILGWRF